MHLHNENIQNQSKHNNHSKNKVFLHCGQKSDTVFVHGHTQCVCCNTNIEPCCEGGEICC